MHWKDQNDMNGVPGASDLAGFAGSATVSGDGSVKIVDVEGSFTFTGHISASGSPTSAGFFVGVVSGGAIANFGAGSQLSSAAPWSVGDSVGSGTVNLSGGATATAFDLGNPAFAAINLGFSGGSGTINISGAGTILDSNGEINVGNAGIGTVMISSGGLLKSRSNDPADAGAQLGAAQSSSGTATVTGMGSQWQNTGQLNVGASGRGTLTVNSGGSVTTGATTSVNPGLMVGFAESGVGIVNVDGMNSKITSNDQTVIGGSGFGTVNITGGGTITSNGGGTTGAILGNKKKADGTVDVSGSGSKWTISSGLIVGGDGTGELDISSQGAVKLSGSPNYLIIGSTKTGLGAVDLSGDGSTLDTGASPITIGDAGMGMLSLSDTAKMSITGDVTIAAQSTSGTIDAPSELDIDGTGTQLVTTKGVHVGGNGFGAVNITAGGLLQSMSGIAGEMANGNGSVDITGDTSQWKITGNLTIGGAGTGTVTVEQGAQLTVMGTDLILGRDQNSNGTLTLRGPSTQFTFAGNPVIGQLGSGTLNVEMGFQLDESTKTLTLGGLQGSTGNLNVRGDSTMAEFNNATIGDAGSGNVVVEKMGLLQNAGNVTLGSQAGGQGGAIIKDDGSKWQIDGNLIIGQSGDSNSNGTGMVTVSDNTTLAVGDGKQIVLGQESGGVGTLVVDGANAHVTGPALEIGRHGVGTLQLQDRAAFAVGPTVLGSQTDGSGRMIVLGVGSIGGQQTTLTVNGTLVVGGASAGVDNVALNESFPGGELGIVNGGQVIVTLGDLVIGRDTKSTGLVNLSESTSLLQISAGAGGVTVGQGGTGTFNISNGAQFSTTFLTVGDAGTGVLSLSNGGKLVSSGNVILGNQNGSKATVTLDGMGTTWTPNGENLIVGNAGDGSLNLQNGAMLANMSLSVDVGKEDGSNGQISVDGANSLLHVSVINLGGGSIGGDGQLKVLNGGTVTADTSVRMGAGSILVAGTGANGGNPSTLTTRFFSPHAPSPGLPELSIVAGGHVFVTTQSSTEFVFFDSGGSSVPALSVIGEGSQLTIPDAQTFINTDAVVNGGGAITVGTLILSSTAGGKLTVGGDPGTTSTVTITSNLQVGLGATSATTLDIGAGGKVNLQNAVGLSVKSGLVDIHDAASLTLDTLGTSFNIIGGTLNIRSAGTADTPSMSMCKWAVWCQSLMLVRNFAPAVCPLVSSTARAAALLPATAATFRSILG